MKQLVLSTFTNIGMLDSGFKKNGFCVVSAGDIIYNSPIEEFEPIPNRFNGVIGGSPCQDFSRLRRTPPTGHGLKMIEEFKRVVVQAAADWFLHENVLGVPDIEIEGYHVIRFHLSPKDLGFSQSRNRRFQFGTKNGLILDIERKPYKGKIERIATASEFFDKENRRDFADFCRLQGLPEDFELTEFHKSAKYRAIGNGVHTGVSFAVAKAIKEAISNQNPKTIFNTNVCACGCGRIVEGKRKTANDTCRKRLSMQNRVKVLAIE